MEQSHQWISMNEKTVGSPKPLSSLLSSQPCSNRELLTAETWSWHSRRKKWISSYLFQLIQASRSKGSLSLACTPRAPPHWMMATNYIRHFRSSLQVRVPHRSFCKSFCICRALCIPESLYSSSFYYPSKLRTKGRFNIYINLFQNRKCSINGRNNNYCYWWLSFVLKDISLKILQAT